MDLRNEKSEDNDFNEDVLSSHHQELHDRQSSGQSLSLCKYQLYRLFFKTLINLSCQVSEQVPL